MVLLLPYTFFSRLLSYMSHFLVDFLIVRIFLNNFFSSCHFLDNFLVTFFSWITFSSLLDTRWLLFWDTFFISPFMVGHFPVLFSMLPFLVYIFLSYIFLGIINGYTFFPCLKYSPYLSLLPPPPWVKLDAVLPRPSPYYDLASVLLCQWQYCHVSKDYVICIWRTIKAKSNLMLFLPKAKSILWPGFTCITPMTILPWQNR